MNTLKQDIDTLFERADSLDQGNLEAFMQGILGLFERLQQTGKEDPAEAKDIAQYLQSKFETRAESLYSKLAAGDQ